MELRRVLRGGKAAICQDTADDADTLEVELKRGDLFVTATDGVFDNLFNHEILTLIQEFK